MMKQNKLNIVPNRSCFYVLPVLNEHYKLEHLDCLQNSYLMNNTSEGLFSVLYKYKGTRAFANWERGLFESKFYHSHNDYDEYVLYKFELPPGGKQLIKHLMNRDLHLTTIQQKKQIIDFANKRGFDGDQMNPFLLGKKTIKPIDIESEIFSNQVEKLNLIDANMLYAEYLKNK